MEELTEDSTTLYEDHEHWTSLWEGRQMEIQHPARTEKQSDPNKIEFDDSIVLVAKAPAPGTVQLTMLHIGTEEDRNRQQWLLQVSLLAPGYIPQVH